MEDTNPPAGLDLTDITVLLGGAVAATGLALIHPALLLVAVGTLAAAHALSRSR